MIQETSFTGNLRLGSKSYGIKYFALFSVVHRKRRKGRFSAVGCRDLLKACEHIAQGKGG